MAAMLLLVHAGYGKAFEPGILVASVGIFMESVLLVCLASLFSTFTTPILSAMFTLSMFLIGHISKDLLVFGERSHGPIFRWASRLLFYALPNLEMFNWKNEVVYGGARSPEILLPAVGYLFCYGAGVLCLACQLFSRKDFK
jgi:hypothetical protein